MQTYISKSVNHTEKIAQKFIKKTSKPAIILLHGDLGAGKTHFVKGIVKGLSSKNMVTSPTFTIMNCYDDGKIPVYHFDMYRLKNVEEAIELGFEEYFDLRLLKGVSVVEWPENVKGLFKGKVIDIKIEKTAKPDYRVIKIEEVVC